MKTRLLLLFLSFLIASSQADWWKPSAMTTWQIQYSGTLDFSLDVQAYDLDLFELNTEQINKLKADNRKIICYFSAGSYEDWRPDASSFPSEVLGKPIDMNDGTTWAGEKWLDIRRIDILGPIMEKRLDMAVQKNCDAVDPDNVDAFNNDSGFPLTNEDQLTYLRYLSNQSHIRGLAIGLKNDLNQIPSLVDDFDFQVNEECFEFGECDKLMPFINQNKPVFGIEYSGEPSDFCPKARSMKFSTLKKNMELGAWQYDCITDTSIGSASTMQSIVTTTTLMAGAGFVNKSNLITILVHVFIAMIFSSL